jgi:hyperosmotically inducible periplasmic protein
MKAQTLRRITLLSAMIIAMAALFMLPACSTTSQMEKTSAIEQSMRDSYGFKTYLQKDDILIKVKGDEVTMEGTVPEASHRFLAEDLARSTAGVKDVDNRLQVEGGTPRHGGDTELGAQVKARLMMHPDVNAAQTEVFVDKGVVTLRGQANTEAQRNLAAEYARNVEGVKNVVNAITVASAGGQGQAGQMASDAATTEKVKSALAANKSTSELAPRVDTKGGIVIIHGTVDNQAQKDLVTQIARSTPGVKDVANEMTVISVG